MDAAGFAHAVGVLGCALLAATGQRALQLVAKLGFAGDAVVAASSRWQVTGNPLWLAAAFIAMGMAAPWLREALGGGLASPRELRAMRRLFGEPSIADMFIRDPRLATWRRKR